MSKNKERRTAPNTFKNIEKRETEVRILGAPWKNGTTIMWTDKKLFSVPFPKNSKLYYDFLWNQFVVI